MTLPQATPRPCNDCPWRRKSCAGWLGPFGIKQCAGAAVYRANVCKSPRDP